DFTRDRAHGGGHPHGRMADVLIEMGAARLSLARPEMRRDGIHGTLLFEAGPCAAPAGWRMVARPAIRGPMPSPREHFGCSWHRSGKERRGGGRLCSGV